MKRYFKDGKVLSIYKLVYMYWKTSQTYIYVYIYINELLAWHEHEIMAFPTKVNSTSAASRFTTLKVVALFRCSFPWKVTPRPTAPTTLIPTIPDFLFFDFPQHPTHCHQIVVQLYVRFNVPTSILILDIMHFAPATPTRIMSPLIAGDTFAAALVSEKIFSLLTYWNWNTL